MNIFHSLKFYSPMMYKPFLGLYAPYEPNK